jgi:hypothetical protein
MSLNPRRNLEAKSLLASIIYKRNYDKNQSCPDHRRDQRINVTVPVCIIPLNEEVPDLAKAFTAVTFDVALRGLCVLANCCLNAENVLVCLVNQSELKILQATRHSQRDLGAGWFRFGLEATGIIKQDDNLELSKHVMSMLSSVPRIMSPVRKWQRYTPNETASALIAPKGTFEANVHDESFGGIGLVFQKPPPIDVGTHVEVIYYGVPVPGTIRRIVAHEDGHCLVGIMWLDEHCSGKRDPASLRKEADFVFLNGIRLVCRIIGRENNSVDARLPDGTTIKTPVDDLTRQTCDKRTDDLQAALTDVRLLVALYELGHFDESRQAVQAVIDFEFAESW